MTQKLIRICLGLFLAAGALATAAPAMASPAAGADVRTAGQAFTAQHTEGLAPAGSAPAPSPSSSNPVDPGTGESGQAKQNRVDYAPYVIGAVVVVVLIAAFLFWRNRRISHPSKPD
jgi:hypothetical protein